MIRIFGYTRLCLGHYNSRVYSFCHSPYDHDLYYSCVWRHASYHDDVRRTSFYGYETTSSSLIVIVWTLTTYYDLSQKAWNGYALMVYMIVQIQETWNDSAQSACPIQTCLNGVVSSLYHARIASRFYLMPSPPPRPRLQCHLVIYRPSFL